MYLACIALDPLTPLCPAPGWQRSVQGQDSALAPLHSLELSTSCLWRAELLEQAANWGQSHSRELLEGTGTPCTVTLCLSSSLPRESVHLASPGVWPQNSRVSPNKLVYLLPSDSTRLLLAVKAVLNSLLEVWGRVMSPSGCLRDWGAALLCTRPYTLWCLPPATSCPWAKWAKPTGETCLRWERLYGLWTSVSSISHCWISHGKISTDLILSLNFLNITDTNRMKNVFDDTHSCQVDLSMSFLVAIKMHSLFNDPML